MSVEALASPQSSVPNPVSPPPTVNLGPVTDTPSQSDTPIKSNVKAFNTEGEISFSDVLDIINPLQHIPIVSTIYRELTGDDEGIVADVIGGGIYGGPIGLMAAMMDIMVKEATGKRVGENVMAMFDGSDDAPTKVADSVAPVTPSDSANISTPAAKAAESSPAEPALAGDYLIFGARTAPVSTSPLASPLPAVDKSSKVKVSGTTTVSSAPAKAAMPSTTNGYLVFGAGTSTGTSPNTSSEVSEKSEQQTASAAPTGRATEGRSWAVPARSGPITARQVLPPPTTGPGALPGGQSVAVTANGAPMNEVSGEWFARAFNQAMDKYQRASRLGDKASESSSGSETLH